MALIVRIEKDMFVFADVVDYVCNPVNLVGAPGAGLALEFRKRIPDEYYFHPYREAIRTKELRVGTVQVLETNHSWGIINFPTKRNYNDLTSREDIVRGLEALRELLQTDKFKHASIGLPMLGCGLGQFDYETFYSLAMDHLSDLDATILLSMDPNKTELRPRYLTIVGPPGFGLKDDDKKIVDETIDKILEKWGTKLEDYTGVVSGGLPGVDAYVCGQAYGKDHEDTLVYRRTGKKPIVVHANDYRNGIGANLTQNKLLCEIGHDIILFKPIGHNNNRMSFMQLWVKNDRQKRANDGHEPRRLAVFGERETTASVEKVVIPVTQD